MIDKEYAQPESETIDWLVYAEYVAYQLNQIGQDIKDVSESKDQYCITLRTKFAFLWNSQQGNNI